MLMIRLSRVGRKNDPSFRIVVTDRRNAAKSGRFLEVVGNYDARHHGSGGQARKGPQINAERAKYFLDHGAKATGTVHNLFVDAGIVSGKKIKPHTLSKNIKRKAKEQEESKENLPKNSDASEGVGLNVLPKKNPPQETPTPPTQGAEQAEGVGVPTSDTPAGAGEASGEKPKTEAVSETPALSSTGAPVPETPATPVPETPIETPAITGPAGKPAETPAPEEATADVAAE